MQTISLVPRHENEAKVDLLLGDAKLALAVLDLADLTHIAELRQLRRQQAAKAYRTIIERLPEVALTDQQRTKMAGTLMRIRKRLPTIA